MAQRKILPALLARAYKAFGISDFPVPIQPLIQQKFLEREILDGLESVVGYRGIADRETFPNGVGETITKTRHGLKAPVTSPMDPSNNTNLDNGLKSSGWTIEQYTMSLNMYGDTIDLNTVTTGVGIAKQFLVNAKVNAVQAMQSLDRLARNALFGAYMSGNTRTTDTLAADGTSVHVDDIRGFTWAIQNGQPLPVSAGNKLAITINGTAHSVQAATPDSVNSSTAPQGISGTLTLVENCTTNDSTAGNAVVSAVAPIVYRAGDHATTVGITAADKLTARMIQNAVADLRSNNVPDVNGAYPCYLTSRQMAGLFRDPEFQMLYRGAYGSEAYVKGRVVELMNARFIETTESPIQVVNGVNVYRAIICGQGALVEGVFEGTGKDESGTMDEGQVTVADGICHITREPLDRLKQIVAQSWYAIVGYAVPTDTTVNTSIIPTSTASAFKRAAILESA